MPPTAETSPPSSDSSPTYELTNRLLGGRAVLRRPIRDEVEAHLRICEGLPTRALVRLSRDLRGTTTPNLVAILGISPRSFRRRKEAVERDPAAKLSIYEGSQLWKFTELLARAAQVLGSKDAAEKWLSSPQIGLDGRRPVELLTTAPGADLVKDQLLRMEFAVYT